MGDLFTKIEQWVAPEVRPPSLTPPPDAARMDAVLGGQGGANVTDLVRGQAQGTIAPYTQGGPLDRWLPLMGAAAGALSTPSAGGAGPIIGAGLGGYAQGRQQTLALQAAAAKAQRDQMLKAQALQQQGELRRAMMENTNAYRQSSLDFRAQAEADRQANQEENRQLRRDLTHPYTGPGEAEAARIGAREDALRKEGQALLGEADAVEQSGDAERAKWMRVRAHEMMAGHQPGPLGTTAGEAGARAGAQTTARLGAVGARNKEIGGQLRAQAAALPPNDPNRGRLMQQAALYEAGAAALAGKEVKDPKVLRAQLQLKRKELQTRVAKYRQDAAKLKVGSKTEQAMQLQLQKMRLAYIQKAYGVYAHNHTEMGLMPPDIGTWMASPEGVEAVKVVDNIIGGQKGTAPTAQAAGPGVATPTAGAAQGAAQGPTPRTRMPSFTVAQKQAILGLNPDEDGATIGGQVITGAELRSLQEALRQDLGR